MYFQRFRVFVLGVVDLSFIITVVRSESNIDKTIHKMCEPVCHEVKTGCSLFVNVTCDSICNRTSINKVQETQVKGKLSIKEGESGYGRRNMKNTERKVNIICREKSYPGQQMTATPKRDTGCNANNLHIACRRGDALKIEEILSRRLEDMNCRGGKGRTAVMVAAREGQVEVCDYLVNHGCDLSAVDEYGDSVLHAACKGGDTGIVRKLLHDEKCDIESRGFRGSTPVMSAAFYGHRKVFAFLVRKGCNMSAVSDDYDNILHWACSGGDVPIVKYILSHDIVDIESRSLFGKTPVMNALLAGDSSRNVVGLLVRMGCNLKAVNNNQENILHYACRSGDVDTVKFVLSKDIVSIDSRGNTGVTPVMSAAFMGHIRVVDLLINRGCDSTVLDFFNNTILHIACIGGHVEMVKYILSKGLISINCKGFCGKTPVMVAASNGHTKLVSFLVRKGCDLTSVDDNMNTILHSTCYGGYVNTLKYVLSLNAVDIDSRGVNRQTPVMVVVMRGFRGMFDLFESRGCNLRVVDGDNDNILHMASLYGQVEMVRYILSRGICDIDSRGQKGKTPVMLAVQKGHKEVVEVLVCNGCNLKSVDDNGNTVSHIACIGGHVSMVKYLIKLGVMDMYEKNIHGQTPVEIAASKGFGHIVALS